MNEWLRRGTVPRTQPKEKAVKRMFLISIAAMLVIAPAAGDAATSKRGTACPDGTVCVWTKKNFHGDREVIREEGGDEPLPEAQQQSHLR